MTLQTTPLRVRVTFRKAVSDGSYGTEAAEVSLEYDCDERNSIAEQARMTEMMLTATRERVHAELSRSPSSAVRRALEPPRPPQTAVIPDDDDEDLPY